MGALRLKMAKTESSGELENLAGHLVATGEGAKEFARALAKYDESEFLRELAYAYTPHDEVSVPVYRRLRELHPEDAQIAAELGFVYWLCGKTDLAKAEAQASQVLDPDNVQGLLLRAALAPEDEEKRRLYGKVLDIEPENVVAQTNLAAL